jgi:hypothetical protein
MEFGKGRLASYFSVCIFGFGIYTCICIFDVAVAYFLNGFSIFCGFFFLGRADQVAGNNLPHGLVS